MKDANLNLQSELFQEFQNNTKTGATNDPKTDNSIFNLTLLKETKVELPFDTLLIIAITLIFTTITFFFLGVKKGREMSSFSQTIEYPRMTPKDMEKPMLVSKSELNQFKQLSEQGPSIPPVKSSPVEIPEPTPALKVPQVKPAISSNIEPVKQGSQASLDHKYTIQVGASKDKKAAQKEVQKLQKKGYEAFLMSSKNSKGSLWYKICVGRFAKSNEASSLIQTMKNKEGRKDCFLTKL